MISLTSFRSPVRHSLKKKGKKVVTGLSSALRDALSAEDSELVLKIRETSLKVTFLLATSVLSRM